MSDNRKSTITVLVPNSVSDGGTEVSRDRKGGESHSLVKGVKAFIFGESELEVATLTKGLDDCLGKMGDVFSNLKKKSIEGWEVESLTVSLGISAEGSIGVVTAGVEGSIQVTFKHASLKREEQQPMRSSPSSAP